MSFQHKPVLLKECIEGLNIKPNGIYVDGTIGGAGHSAEILKRLGSGGLLIGLDQDEEAVRASTERLEKYGRQIGIEYIENVYTHTKDENKQITKEENYLSTKEEAPYFMVVKTNFENVKEVLENAGINAVDGILLDIGVSSHQLDEAERGFSYMNDAFLDMRMDRENELSAFHVVNKYSEKELCAVIRNYGEEKWASRIANFIVEYRGKKPIETTFQLVDIIKAAIPKGAREEGQHPAKRTFQAIRIEVNRELKVLENVIDEAVPLLNKGGRLCIITFHSLEDRIVKTKFQNMIDPCTCPRDFPVCVCGRVPTVKAVTRKPIISTKEELSDNPRARSAKLRIVEKIY